MDVYLYIHTCILAILELDRMWGVYREQARNLSKTLFYLPQDDCSMHIYIYIHKYIYYLPQDDCSMHIYNYVYIYVYIIIYSFVHVFVCLFALVCFRIGLSSYLCTLGVYDAIAVFGISGAIVLLIGACLVHLVGSLVLLACAGKSPEY